MSSPDPFPVVNCVSNIISIFRDCHEIVHRIKAQRQARDVPAPSRYLEDSLFRGPQAVETELRNGLERFGRTYAIGDSKHRTLLLAPYS